MGINTKYKNYLKVAVYRSYRKRKLCAHWKFSFRFQSRDLSKSFHNGGTEMLSPVNGKDPL